MCPWRGSLRTTSVFIDRGFSASQKLMSASTSLLVVPTDTCAGGSVLYIDLSVAASPTSTAAFHCSNGANDGLGSEACAQAHETANNRTAPNRINRVIPAPSLLSQMS